MGLGAIAGALFSTGASAPSVRRPAFEVQFGSASAEDWGQALVGFTVELGTAPFVDAAEIHAAATRGPTAASGDTGTIKAGYEDASTDAIFAGAIETTRYTVDGLTRYTAVT